MKLADLLLKEAVFPHVDARDKKQALKTLSALAAPLCGAPEKEVLAGLMDREQRGSTCMGSGVCIPHARLSSLARPYAFFARFDQPVAYDGADGKPVDLMFTLLSQQDANADYVKSLALLTKLLRNKKLCADLRQAVDGMAIYNLLNAASNEDAA